MKENNDNHRVWITWENQRRSIELSKAFQADLLVLDEVFKSKLMRYLYCSSRTIYFLKNKKPRYVFGQNPSIILALLLCIFKNIFKYKLIIDRHSNFRYGKSNSIVNYIFHKISDYTIRNSDLTIVTNEYLKDVINAKGGSGLVLEDKLPEMNLGEYIDLSGKVNVVYISSFSSDEPTDKVIEAFKQVDNSIHLFITGNYKSSIIFADKSKFETENIHFTGYLDEKQFQSLLVSADILIVLTTNDHTLTCGAYEGVTLVKPMILSNTKAIKDYFNKGVLYCNPDIESIRFSLDKVIENYENLKSDLEHLKSTINDNWRNRFEKVSNDIFC